MSSEYPAIESIAQSASRIEVWKGFINANKIKRMAEIGVYRGDLAAELLKSCGSIHKYYMIDPWRHLDDWEKPANKSNDEFERYLEEVKEKTSFAAKKRIILRGRTIEVIDEVGDDELDFAYIDGDHTLRGITIDLIRVYSKIRMGGWIGGDDLSSSIWQHGINYEPTFVFPFVLYFAEAVGAHIYALPHKQFLIEKRKSDSFAFTDLTGSYSNSSIKNQLRPIKLLGAMTAGVYLSVDELRRKLRG